MSFLKKYADYYDVLYKDKDYKAETDYIETLMKRYKPDAKSIIDLGCGTGVHASILSGKGYVVHGVDASNAMLEKAEKRRAKLNPDVAERLSFQEADIREYSNNKKYDVATALFHVVNYIELNEDLDATFDNIRNLLNPGGIILFDSWYGPSVLKNTPLIRVKRVNQDHVALTRISEPDLRVNDNSVVVNYTVFIRNCSTGEIREEREVHRMRYLFLPEIKKLLNTVGIRMLAAREWMTENEPSLDTFSVCIAGRIL